MEIQTTPSVASVQTLARAGVSTQITATVVTRTTLHTYEVVELQAAGARLRGGPPPPVRRAFEIVLRVPCYPPIRVYARVDRPAAPHEQSTRVVFIHTSDRTEDHIQAALLSELERQALTN